MYKSRYSFKGQLPKPCSTISVKRGESKIISPRNWQNSAFNLISFKNALIQAFCGSGKSILAIMVACSDAVFSKRKQLIIVPQKHIGNGFLAHGRYEIPELGDVEYCKPADFCNSCDEAKIDALINFLTTPFKKLDQINRNGKSVYVIDNCFAVATHAAFSRAMSKITAEKKKTVPICLTIDESHHVKTKGVVSFDFNQLGKYTNYLYKNLKNRFLFMSATPWRSDQGSLLPQGADFEVFNYDFIDHFKTLNIENVNVNFVEFKENPVDKMISNIKKSPENNHLIIVPSKNSKWRKEDPDLSIFWSKIYANFPPEMVLDLVTESTQNKNKKILLSMPKERKSESDESEIKIIVTCMLGREGTDWCACDSIHNLSIEGKSGSGLAVQTFGRACRKFEGKTNVDLFYYVKKFVTLNKSKTKREFISERLNVILAIMLIDDLFAPIQLNYFTSENKDNKTRAWKVVKDKISLRDVFGESQFNCIKKEIFEGLFELGDLKDANVDAFVRNTIEKYEQLVPCKQKDVVDAFKCLILRAKSQKLRNSQFNISELRTIGGFDIVVEKNDIGGNFYCGKLNAKTMKKYREFISKKLWTQEEEDQIANNIIKLFSKKLQREPTEKDKQNINLFMNDLKHFHSTYSSLKEFTFENFYQNLKTLSTKKKVLERIKQINKVLPFGCDINFIKASNLINKISIYRMGA